MQLDHEDVVGSFVFFLSFIDIVEHQTKIGLRSHATVYYGNSWYNSGVHDDNYIDTYWGLSQGSKVKKPKRSALVKCEICDNIKHKLFAHMFNGQTILICGDCEKLEQPKDQCRFCKSKPEHDWFHFKVCNNCLREKTERFFTTTQTHTTGSKTDTSRCGACKKSVFTKTVDNVYIYFGTVLCDTCARVEASNQLYVHSMLSNLHTKIRW